MKNENNTIMVAARINNQDLVILNENADKLVPIKPICSALGIDFKSQYTKLKDDENLSSVMVLSTTTGADGKNYEMVCIPLKYVFGWLFTINPGNVSPEAKEIILKYRMECYDVLFNHFSERSAFIEEKQKIIQEYMNQLEETQDELDNTKNRLKTVKQNLEKAKRFTFEEWKENNRQLVIPFET